MNIKFGVHHGTNCSGFGHNPTDILKSALMAERLGYNSVWVMDHLYDSAGRPQALVVEPWTMLAAIAAKTRKVSLGTCVTDPHRRNPAVVAQTVSTLDHISNGRAILGIGAGEAMNLDQYGVVWDKPVSRLMEALQLYKMFWSSSFDKPISFDGKFWKVEKACLQIYSIQKPHPPIYLAANAPKTLKICGEMVQGWIPSGCDPDLYKECLEIIRKAAENAGRSFDEIEKTYEIWIAIHKDYDKAREAIEMPAKLLTLNKKILEKYGVKLPEGLSLHKLWTEFTSTNTRVINLFKEYVDRIPTEATERVNAFGTPDDVIESFERFIDVGVRHFIIEFFGPDYWESIKLFSKKVAPYFKRK